MNKFTPDLEKQKRILERHLGKEQDGLLKKYSTKIEGMSGFTCVYTTYELAGLSNYEKHLYLPHFEFNIGNSARADLDERLMGKIAGASHASICASDDVYGMKVNFRDGENTIAVPVYIKTAKDLFSIRNSAGEKPISIEHILIVPEFYSAEAIAKYVKFGSEFYFRASSTSHGQLVAQMKIDHPTAETVIEKFLANVDEQFEKYKELEKHFRQKDEIGNVLWEDQNLQSKEYNALRRKLHTELFGSLEAVFRKEGVKYKGFYHSTSDSLKSFIKQLIF